MTSFARSVQQKADTVQDEVETKMAKVVETVKETHNKIKEKTASLNPKVGIPFPAYDPWPDTQNLIYGFANGVVDVFPYESLPSRCRGNITQIYQAINNLFFADPLPYSWPDNDLDYMYEVQSILQFPYGVTFSCAFSFM